MPRIIWVKQRKVCLIGKCRIPVGYKMFIIRKILHYIILMQVLLIKLCILIILWIMGKRRAYFKDINVVQGNAAYLLDWYLRIILNAGKYSYIIWMEKRLYVQSIEGSKKKEFWNIIYHENYGSNAICNNKLNFPTFDHTETRQIDSESMKMHCINCRWHSRAQTETYRHFSEID